jgi:hypothetical protein
MEFQLHVTISYGEVEDYTVNIGRCRGYLPNCSIKLSFWNDYHNYKFIMDASSDNVAVTGYNVYQGSTLKSDCNKYFICCHWLTANSNTFSVKAKMLPEHICHK